MSMSRSEQRDSLIFGIKDAVTLGIHKSVCYMFNYCGLPLEKMNELCDHYYAICRILEEWQKSEKEKGAEERNG